MKLGIIVRNLCNIKCNHKQEALHDIFLRDLSFILQISHGQSSQTHSNSILFNMVRVWRFDAPIHILYKGIDPRCRPFIGKFDGSIKVFDAQSDITQTKEGASSNWGSTNSGMFSLSGEFYDGDAWSDVAEDVRVGDMLSGELSDFSTVIEGEIWNMGIEEVDPFH